MKPGDIVLIRTGKRGRRAKGEVVEVLEGVQKARVSRKGYGIEIYPFTDLEVQDGGYPA